MIRLIHFPTTAPHLKLIFAAVFFVFFLSLDVRLQAQEHQYHFHYYPVNPDTSLRYLYDWYEIEPDGWMRRDAGMFKEELYDLYGTLEPEGHPEGTSIYIRVSNLDGEVLDERTFVCRDTTILQFGPVESDFRMGLQHQTNPDASIYDTGYMFVAEDDTAVVEFFNLTGEKVRFEHGWFYWDQEEEAFHAGQGVSGRTSEAVIKIPVSPRFGSVQMHYFEFVTADMDTLMFNANVVGDVVLGSHLLFQERDRGSIVLGRVLASKPPR